MPEFIDIQPTLENYWRSIILFGRNVASYKFALGQSLLEFATREQEVIALTDLAVPFARKLCEHLRTADKQATSTSSKFLDVCRKFNAQEISETELIDSTTKLGFNNVIDAFHVVHDGEIGVRFFTDERAGKERGVRLTDNVFRLTETIQFDNLLAEIEARWRLVETAWDLKMPRTVLTVSYEDSSGLLVTSSRDFERKAITSCRDALNGYQKGKCFYCFGDIGVVDESLTLAEVDHFFPHVLKQHQFVGPLDGVWNLVLACPTCNRGSAGKFARLPELRFLERLHTRNSFYIESHHPLKETLIAQTGATEQQRRQFLQAAYHQAKQLLILQWKPAFEHEPAF